MKKHLDLRFNIALWLILAFLVNLCWPIPLGQAQEFRLPKPGVMVNLSPTYTPVHLTGMSIHPDDALKFDFLIDTGDESLSQEQKKQVYTKLVKYFLASLTIPDNDQWVNLSPYEHGKIIPDNFGKTEMGRDLLGQDYLLKQITSSLIYPEKELGKKFWDKVYGLAWKEYGTTDIPVNTFNKVWIIPDQSAVYESGDSVFILRNHLKVMLEEDYLSLNKHITISNHSIASRIVREIIIPALEKEVNEGKNFAQLRQIYSGMILATWYKEVLKGSLLEKTYADKSRLKGINQDPKFNEQIFQQYLKAFKKGVFNYIKEDVGRYSKQTIPRKYFSGGALDFASVTRDVTRGFQPRSLLILDPTTLVPGRKYSRIDFNAIAPKHIDRATIALDDIKSVRRLERDPEFETIGFEFECQIADQVPHYQRGQMYPRREWKREARKILQEVNEILPRGWKRQFSLWRWKTPRNFFEFTTNTHGSYNDDHFWRELTRTIEALQEGTLRGGILSIHANIGDQRIPLNPESHRFNIDELCLARVVKVYEAMWRALAGRGWSEASSNVIQTLYLNALNKDVGDYKRGILNRVSIINLRDDHMEIKMFEGDRPSLLGKEAKLVDPYNLRQRTDWGFSLLHFAAEDYEQAPLAVLGLPVLAGHKPTRKQIDHFIELFFSGENTERRQYVKSVFRSLENELPGKTRKEILEDDNVVADYYIRLGLRSVYLMHHNKDGYDPNLVHHFLTNPKALNELAEDLVQASFSSEEDHQEKVSQQDRIAQEDKISLDYFPLEMRPSLQKALDRARIRLSEIESPRVESAFRSPSSRELPPNSSKDRAAISNHASPLGGIDFNSRNLNLQIKRDGRGVPLPLDKQDMAQLNRIQGFMPYIIEIRPESRIPILSEIEHKLHFPASALN